VADRSSDGVCGDRPLEIELEAQCATRRMRCGITHKPLVDAFLAGWTQDGGQLICFRDWRFFTASLNGKESPVGTIPDREGDPNGSTASQAFTNATTSGVSFQCMNQFIRLAQAPAIAVVFASVFGGCATPESDGRATVLCPSSSIHLTARTSPRRISIGWMRRWNGSSSRHGRATATAKHRLV
jgi:hypothetical protein